MSVLETLASVEPPWTLTGGGALILALGHRTTRDLDLLWAGRTQISEVARIVRDTLIRAPYEVVVLQTGYSFERLSVSRRGESVIVDLMAEPNEPLEAHDIEVGSKMIRAESMHAGLVNKLCALLGRLELRDLDDVRTLLTAGEDLTSALQEAPERDAGFSALTLAWVLESFPARRLALTSGWTNEEADAIDAFRLTLIQRLTESSTPA